MTMGYLPNFHEPPSNLKWRGFYCAPPAKQAPGAKEIIRQEVRAVQSGVFRIRATSAAVMDSCGCNGFLTFLNIDAARSRSL